MRVITLTKKKSCTIFMNGIMFAYIMTSKIKDTFKLLQNSFPIKLMIFLYHARYAGDGTRIRHVCGLENGMADEDCQVPHCTADLVENDNTRDWRSIKRDRRCIGDQFNELKV